MKRKIRFVSCVLDAFHYPQSCPKGVFELPFSLVVCILMRRGEGRNS